MGGSHKRRRPAGSAAAALLLCSLVATPALPHPHSPLGDRSASNRDHYIQLGEAVHGGFGPLIALGVRLGDDAMKTLGAGPRQIDVTYFEGVDSPCACVVDGVMLVSASSPGQGTLRVAREPAGEGLHGRVVIRNKRSGETVEYSIPASVNPFIREALKAAPDKRWDLVMDAPEATLFSKRMIGITR
jgi:hypothetical protein